MEKKIYCNKCGRELLQNQEEYLTIKKQWGYFSGVDQKVYRFHICEECFAKMLSEFRQNAGNRQKCYKRVAMK